MDCDDIREALSARLDDEEGAQDAARPVEEHLELCGECASWYETAALITRRTRTTAAVAWPDVTDAVLARVSPGVDRRVPGLRLGLGGLAVTQCGLAVTTFLADSGDYQTGAWQLALGAAYGAVAVRRTAPSGLVPLLGTFVGALALGQVGGLTDGAGVASLLLAAAGLLVVWLLGRRPPEQPDTRPPAAARVSAPTVSDQPEPDEEDAVIRHLSIRVAPTTKSA